MLSSGAGVLNSSLKLPPLTLDDSDTVWVSLAGTLFVPGGTVSSVGAPVAAGPAGSERVIVPSPRAAIVVPASIPVPSIGWPTRKSFSVVVTAVTSVEPGLSTPSPEAPSRIVSPPKARMKRPEGLKTCTR